MTPRSRPDGPRSAGSAPLGARHGHRSGTGGSTRAADPGTGGPRESTGAASPRTDRRGPLAPPGGAGGGQRCDRSAGRGGQPERLRDGVDTAPYRSGPAATDGRAGHARELGGPAARAAQQRGGARGGDRRKGAASSRHGTRRCGRWSTRSSASPRSSRVPTA